MPKRKSKAKQAMALLRKNDEITAFIDYIKDPDIKIETFNAIKKLIQDAKDLADKKQPALEVVEKQINQTSDEKSPAPQEQPQTTKPVKTAETADERSLFSDVAKKGLLSSAKKHLASIDNANLVSHGAPILVVIAAQPKDNRQANRNKLFHHLITQRKEIDVNLAQTNDGTTPLCFAAQNGHIEIVESLLDAPSIDVNRVTINDGSSPLYIATQQEHTEVVGRLLDAKGIKVNQARISDGATPLYIAAYKGHTDIVKLLLGAKDINVNQAIHSGGEPPLHIAAQEGHAGTVELLLGAPGIEVNQARHDGVTPLYVAAQQGHADTVRLLLGAQSINVNQATTDDGTPPLYVAAYKGHTNIVELLLGAPGIEVNQARHDGVTPLHIAAQKGHTEIVRLLLNKSADALIKIDNDATPLHIAAQEGHTDVVELLLGAQDINVNQATIDDGATPLCIAADNGHAGVVELLLDAPGIDVNQAKHDGSTPLALAVQEGHTTIVELFLNSGKRLDFAFQHKHGPEEVMYPVLDLARFFQHYSIMQILQDHFSGTTPDEKQAAPTAPIAAALRQQPEEASDRSADIPPEPKTKPTQTAASRPEPTDPQTDQDNAGLQLIEIKYKYISDIQRKKYAPWLDAMDRMSFIVQLDRAKTENSVKRIYRDFLSLIMDEKKQQQPHADEKGNKSKPSQAPATFHIGKKAYKEEDLVAAVQAELIDPKNRPFAHGACHKLADGKTSPTDYCVIINGNTLPVRHCSAGVPGVGSCSLFFFLDEKQNRIVIIAIGYHDETIKPVKGQPRFKYRFDRIDDNYFTGRKSAVVGA